MARRWWQFWKPKLDQWQAEAAPGPVPHTGHLTLDELCAAIRFQLRQAACSSRPPRGALRIFGCPGDDVMKAVLESCGGKLVIEVNEVPQGIVELTRETADTAPQQAPPVSGGTVWGG